MNDGIGVRWVIARYTAGSPQGRTALSLSGEGLGYTLMNPHRGRSDDVIVAFRRPDISALPNHLEYATPQQVEQLEQKARDRSGRH